MTNYLPAWAGSVDSEALARLLGFGGERDWLDYKSQCDLSSTRDLVEITKDIGALMITGGYIVVGADDHGLPAGEPAHIELFDRAHVHAKVAKYISKPFKLRVAVHRHQGQSFAVVYVAPHPDGLCVFEHTGNYIEPGMGTRTVFRTGDVFARHGTASEPWNQRDIAAVKRRLAADADHGRDQAAEALSLVSDLPRRLGGTGLWLAVVVVPEYRPTDPTKTMPDAAQRFLSDWAFASAPSKPLPEARRRSASRAGWSSRARPLRRTRRTGGGWPSGCRRSGRGTRPGARGRSQPRDG
jgi:Schlafen, AlbA_2